MNLFRSVLFLFFGIIIGSIISSYTSAWDFFIKNLPQNTKNNIFTSTKIQEAQKLIQDKYYKFSEKPVLDIENGMLTALVESLWDKHSSYFPPKEAKEFIEVLSGDFEGIGAVIDEHVRGIIIRKVFQDSPAKKAWLQDGDIITKVDSESVVWLTSEEAVKKIRWPKWSTVTIEYLRWDMIDSQKVIITRDTIVIPSTSERMFTGALSDVWYIEVSYFGERTTEEFEASLKNLTASWTKAIILDLRNNGWGYLDTAVNLLSYFLPANTLAVTTKETDPTKNLPLYTHTTSITDTKIPLIMLVNNLSASATEIMAGAFQDYKRAIIVGEKTYGKWSVQEPFLMSDGSMLKITIAKWYTPKDKNIDHDGITPDILIPIFERDFASRYDRQLEYTKEIIDTLLSSNMTYDALITEIKSKDFTK